MEKKREQFLGKLYRCLGRQIEQRRKRLGLSQQSLSAAAKVDRAFISDLEGGKRKPSLGTVANIAQGLRMRLSRLVQNCERCTGRD